MDDPMLGMVVLGGLAGLALLSFALGLAFSKIGNIVAGRTKRTSPRLPPEGS